MNQEELEKGKKLADASLKWHRSTMPGYEIDMYTDEPIPLLIKWLKQHAFPKLEVAVEMTELQGGDTVSGIAMHKAEKGEAVEVRIKQSLGYDGTAKTAQPEKHASHRRKK